MKEYQVREITDGIIARHEERTGVMSRADRQALFVDIRDVLIEQIDKATKSKNNYVAVPYTHSLLVKWNAGDGIGVDRNFIYSE